MRTTYLGYHTLLLLSVLSQFCTAGFIAALVRTASGQAVMRIFKMAPEYSARQTFLVNNCVKIAYTISTVIVAAPFAGAAGGGVSIWQAFEALDKLSDKDREKYEKELVAAVKKYYADSYVATAQGSIYRNAALSSLAAMTKSQAAQPYDTANVPFPSFTYSKRYIVQERQAEPSSAGITVAAASTPSSGATDASWEAPISGDLTVTDPFAAPAGVPQYNFDMCRTALESMVSNNVNVSISQPQAQSVRIDGVPSECMVLAPFIMNDPNDHVIPMGSAALLWNQVPDADITRIRTFFGAPQGKLLGNGSMAVNDFGSG